MGRITHAIYPTVEAGTPRTDFTYYDGANTVTRTVAADPDPAQTITVTFDGLGRETHRYMSDTPSQDIIDTTYDSDGRIHTVSNPYRSPFDATYGITTIPMMLSTGRHGSWSPMAINSNGLTQEASHNQLTKLASLGLEPVMR